MVWFQLKCKNEKEKKKRRHWQLYGELSKKIQTNFAILVVNPNI